MGPLSLISPGSLWQSPFKVVYLSHIQSFSWFTHISWKYILHFPLLCIATLLFISCVNCNCKIYFHLIMSNLWACVLREGKGRSEKLLLQAACSGTPPFHWGPGCVTLQLTPPSPFIDFPALHSSETRNFPAKVMCLATSIILAVGKRIENSTKQMEWQSAFGQPDRGTQALFQVPPTLERLKSLNCQLPQLGWALIFLPVLESSPTPIPQSAFSASLTSFWFLLNSHNSLQKQVFAKPSCSDPWPRVSEYCSPCAELWIAMGISAENKRSALKSKTVSALRPAHKPLESRLW